MSDLTKRLCRPGYDLQKEQATQEAVIEIRELRAEVQTWKQQSESYWEKIEAMERQAPVQRFVGRRNAQEREPAMQDALMKFDPATGEERPYPSHATQWRNWHGSAAWLFDPWTGRRRNAHDVGSDVHGLLIAPAGTLGMDMGGGCAEAKP